VAAGRRTGWRSAGGKFPLKRVNHSLDSFLEHGTWFCGEVELLNSPSPADRLKTPKTDKIKISRVYSHAQVAGPVPQVAGRATTRMLTGGGGQGNAEAAKAGQGRVEFGGNCRRMACRSCTAWGRALLKKSRIARITHALLISAARWCAPPATDKDLRVIVSMRNKPQGRLASLAARPFHNNGIDLSRIENPTDLRSWQMDLCIFIDFFGHQPRSR